MAKNQQKNQAEQEEEKPECLICNNDAATRGLCSKCYSKASSLVKKGTTTWEALEAAQLVLPSRKPVAEPSKFLAAFEKVGSPSGKKQETAE